MGLAAEVKDAVEPYTLLGRGRSPPPPRLWVGLGAEHRTVQALLDRREVPAGEARRGDCAGDSCPKRPDGRCVHPCLDLVSVPGDLPLLHPEHEVVPDGREGPLA